MAQTSISQPIEHYLAGVSALVAGLRDAIAAATELLLAVWRRGRVYICGNGGGAAIASHFAGDLNKGANIASRHRFHASAHSGQHPRLLAGATTRAPTPAEQLRNFVEPDDLVIGISGNSSTNVVNALARPPERAAALAWSASTAAGWPSRRWARWRSTCPATTWSRWRTPSPCSATVCCTPCAARSAWNLPAAIRWPASGAQLRGSVKREA